jgi:hypothetical protein
MNKIIVGTSKLGWDLKKQRLYSHKEVINYSLKKNIDIHLSPSYGYALNYVKSCKSLNQSKSKFIIKLSFDTKENFYHQLFYVMEIIGINKKIDIQIDEFFNIKNIKALKESINKIKKKFIIRDIYLTPLKKNYIFFLKNIKKFKEFNYAIHYSFVENNFDHTFMKLIKKQNKKIISLRGLGGGLRNIDFKDFYTTNYNQNRFLLKKIEAFLKKNNISEIDARAQYVLKNSLISKMIISSSKIKNLVYLKNLEKKNFSKKKLKLLSIFSNKNFLSKSKNIINNNEMFYKRHNILIFIKSLYVIKKYNFIKHNYILKSLIYLPRSFINLIIYKVKIFIISNF